MCACTGGGKEVSSRHTEWKKSNERDGVEAEEDNFTVRLKVHFKINLKVMLSINLNYKVNSNVLNNLKQELNLYVHQNPQLAAVGPQNR